MNKMAKETYEMEDLKSGEWIDHIRRNPDGEMVWVTIALKEGIYSGYLRLEK